MNSSAQPDPAGQPSKLPHFKRGKWRQRKGVALILVVSFIVLMSALVVGFFSRVTTELTSARSYAESISARQLAESAVSVVMGQIRAATTVPNGCWASQPGMIRVYGNGTIGCILGGGIGLTWDMGVGGQKCAVRTVKITHPQFGLQSEPRSMSHATVGRNNPAA